MPKTQVKQENHTYIKSWCDATDLSKLFYL